MPVLDAYCQTTDLLLGNIPTPGYMAPDRYVTDAADEIDSKIGFIYITRVDVSNTSVVVKPARLLLKRLNVFLASGRLLMAAAAAQEDNQTHAYARSLVKEAEDALNLIATGQLVLPGAPKVVTDGETVLTGPMQANKDPESNVDAFYDRIVNPKYVYPYPSDYGVYHTPGGDQPFPDRGFVR